MDIQRHSMDTLTITVGANVAGAEAVDARHWSGAMLHVPAAFSTAAAFVFYVGSTATGTFQEWLPSSLSETNPVTVSPGKSTDVPAGLFPTKFLKIVNAAGAGDITADPKG